MINIFKTGIVNTPPQTHSTTASLFQVRTALSIAQSMDCARSFTSQVNSPVGAVVSGRSEVCPESAHCSALHSPLGHPQCAREAHTHRSKYLKVGSEINKPLNKKILSPFLTNKSSKWCGRPESIECWDPRNVCDRMCHQEGLPWPTTSNPSLPGSLCTPSDICKLHPHFLQTAGHQECPSNAHGLPYIILIM